MTRLSCAAVVVVVVPTVQWNRNNSAQYQPEEPLHFSSLTATTAPNTMSQSHHTTYVTIVMLMHVQALWNTDGCDEMFNGGKRGAIDFVSQQG